MAMAPPEGKGKRKGGRGQRITGKLRPADPFDLIRWLARSQSDPRKAVAELIQNSLDAGASEIHVVRSRERGATLLRVLDNGSGVLPHLLRAEALEYLATHIGQSLKQELTVQQRHELLVQGKYGIGLLGFWSVSESFEIATQVDGSEVWRLVLREDSSEYHVEKIAARLDRSDSWTEVTLRGIHRAALSVVSGRRLTDYLASELRGQLLHRNVQVDVTDRLARGRGIRYMRVEPRRFRGEPLADLPDLVVPGYSNATVELYLLPAGDASGRITLAAQGTVVADDIASLESFGLDRPPWSGGQINGIIDFPDFEVAPGSRRGIVPNQAALSFFTALDAFEVPLLARLERERESRAAALEGSLVRELRRILYRMPQALPQYDFFPLTRRRDQPLAAIIPPAGGATGEPTLGVATEILETPEEEPSSCELFPPGPLDHLEVRPARAKVLRGTDLRLTARAVDGRSRRIEEPVLLRWRCESSLGDLEDLGHGAAVFHAGGDEGLVAIEAIADAGELSATARCNLEIVAAIGTAQGDQGIPDPELIDAPMEEWRSRTIGDQWQVNSGHPDFIATSHNGRLRLRYLLSLLVKEVVLRSFGRPADSVLLEKFVEVLAFSERHLER